MHGDLEHQRLTHGARNLAEELARQVGLMAMAQEGAAVKAIDRVEQGRADVGPEAGFEVNTRFVHPAPFAARFLAFLGREGREVLIEVGVVLVGPVKLAVATQ